MCKYSPLAWAVVSYVTAVRASCMSVCVREGGGYTGGRGGICCVRWYAWISPCFTVLYTRKERGWGRALCWKLGSWSEMSTVGSFALDYHGCEGCGGFDSVCCTTIPNDAMLERRHKLRAS